MEFAYGFVAGCFIAYVPLFLMGFAYDKKRDSGAEKTLKKTPFEQQLDNMLRYDGSERGQKVIEREE